MATGLHPGMGRGQLEGICWHSHMLNLRYQSGNDGQIMVMGCGWGCSFLQGEVAR